MSSKTQVLSLLLCALVACTSSPVKTQNGDRWVTGGKDKKPVAVKTAKPKETKGKAWETTGSGGAFGGLGLGKMRSKSEARDMMAAESAADMAAAPAPAAKTAGPSGSGVSGGVISSGARAKASASKPVKAPPVALGKKVPMREAHRRNVTAEPQTDLLTAGTFDDALDMDVFERFWRGSPLSQRPVPAAKKPPTKKAAALQLAFVVDTTGSMGDELEYLKAEFKTIVAEVNKSHPDVTKEFAVIVYKDDGDEYVTRGLSFSTNIAEVQRFIDEQGAGGGGDYPEAVDTAFEEALARLQWESGDKTAKMLFHIADAPPHDKDLDVTFKHGAALREKGIGVYPVASSGVADMAEAVMRGLALMTGGQYVFLTDDSGVGHSHQAPKHPCYHVEKLKDVMVRMVTDRVAGTRTMPAGSKIVRTVGNPQDATCKTKMWTAR